MGAGKTTTGKLLAGKLNIPFIDTDKEIEKRAGRSIKQSCAEEGEKFFRKIESDFLKDLLSEEKGRMVIACGGGTPVREENRKLLRDLGTVVYLEVSADTIFDRIGSDSERPLLLVEDPKKKIRHLLEERESAYRDAADVTVDAGEGSQEAVSLKILQAF